jgi:hypothetical protein
MTCEPPVRSAVVSLVLRHRSSMSAGDLDLAALAAGLFNQRDVCVIGMPDRGAIDRVTQHRHDVNLAFHALLSLNGFAPSDTFIPASPAVPQPASGTPDRSGLKRKRDNSAAPSSWPPGAKTA